VYHQTEEVFPGQMVSTTMYPEIAARFGGQIMRIILPANGPRIAWIPGCARFNEQEVLIVDPVVLTPLHPQHPLCRSAMGLPKFPIGTVTYLARPGLSSIWRPSTRDFQLAIPDAKLWQRVTRKREREVQISVFTVNIFFGNGTGIVHRLGEHLRQLQPDVVLVQESRRETLEAVVSLDPYSYQLAHFGGPSVYEKMALLLRLDSGWTLGNVTPYESTMCFTRRTAFVYTMSHIDTRTVQLANVHLCGGSIDERSHTADTVPTFESIKTELIGKLVPSTDIVAGDFNSDMLHFVGQVSARPHYLGWGGDKLSVWNKSPFHQLQASGYRHVTYAGAPHGIEPTSYYGTAPDAIWFNDSFALSESRVVCMGAVAAAENRNPPHSSASDHEGLFAAFKFKEARPGGVLRSP
jgi:endonuclease/exonuclease/phosphatase (EEP) superfamily protein YafD